MGFIKEFREFAIKGNVMDLAIGIIIGAAFSSIIASLVNDIVMPVIGVFFSADFTNLYYLLGGTMVPEGATLEEARALGPVLAWGNFVTVLFNFILIAFVIFLLVKGINNMRRKKPEETAQPTAPSTTDAILMEIRDQLKKQP